MKRKKSMQSTSPNSSLKLDVDLELDIKALRGKNKQLTQEVAKLKQDKKSQQDQITSLQEDFFNLNSKYVNLKNIFSNIDAAAKTMFPKQVELVEMFGRIMQLCAVGVTVSNISKDPVTQPVKPHTVNGHVLRNPTVSLPRFDNESPSRTPPRTLEPLNINLIASSSQEQLVSDDDSSSTTIREEDTNDVPMVTRRTCPERQDVENTSESESFEEEETISKSEYCSRLMTIQEEDEEQCSTSLSSIDNSQNELPIREVRILLNPLSKETMLTDSSLTSSSSYSNYSASVEQSTSAAVTYSREISNSSLERSEDTIKIMTSQNSIIQASSLLESSRYCSKDDSSSSDMDESVGIFRIQNRRNRHVAKLASSGDESINTSLSLIQKPGVYDNSSAGPSDIDMDFSKNDTSRSIDLTSRNSQLMVTSTPVLDGSRSSSRNKILNGSIKNLTKMSPTVSKVTKKRGSSKDKIVQVLLNRVKEEKRLSGSPLKKVCDFLSTSPITKSANLKKGKNMKNRQSSDNEEVQPSSPMEQKPIIPETKSSKKNRNNKTKVIIQGKENRHSPRPSRAVKPTQLKEPSLNKKMRRSR